MSILAHTNRARKERETGEKQRGRKPTPPEKVELTENTKANVTDPESSLKKPYDVWIQGYNGQTMVECDTQVIVAEAVTADPNGKQPLEPMLERCEQTTGEPPAKVLADAGYCSRANLQLGDEQTELFIATTTSRKRH